jgi:hypothetical protein
VAQQLSARAGFVVLAALLGSAACDGNNARLTGQMSSAPTAALPVRVSPMPLQLSPIIPASCPMSQPFTTHLDLVLGPADIDFFVDAVSLRFGDGDGSLILFTIDDLDRMFGSRRVPAGSNQVFRLNPQFGCGLSTLPRSLSVGVSMIDGRGRRHQTTTTAPFD